MSGTTTGDGMDALRRAVDGCSGCERDEAEGGVVDHCDACCRRITTELCRLTWRELERAQQRSSPFHSLIGKTLADVCLGPKESWPPGGPRCIDAELTFSDGTRARIDCVSVEVWP